tara:strand:+ start:307 stop:459 length:153 start_codon:yes stop_codon:yes gene_type:complete
VKKINHQPAELEEVFQKNEELTKNSPNKKKPAYKKSQLKSRLCDCLSHLC